jgi:hypothetical protein
MEKTQWVCPAITRNFIHAAIARRGLRTTRRTLVPVGLARKIQELASKVKKVTQECEQLGMIDDTETSRTVPDARDGTSVRSIAESCSS